MSTPTKAASAAPAVATASTHPPEDTPVGNPNGKQAQQTAVEDLPPLRMHATMTKPRLVGAAVIPASPRSRSRSPFKDRFFAASHTATTQDANSSISSLDDIVDLDILTDRAGLEELDLSESQRKMHLSRELVSNLPSVNERMSEDALEDVHAFSDVEVVRSSNASRANSIGTGGGAVLEPLSEYDGDEDDDDLDDIQEEDEQKIILTNMENLTLQLDQEPGVARGTAASSLVEEAPSGPTA